MATVMDKRKRVVALLAATIILPVAFALPYADADADADNVAYC